VNDADVIREILWYIQGHIDTAWRPCVVSTFGPRHVTVLDGILRDLQVREKELSQAPCTCARTWSEVPGAHHLESCPRYVPDACEPGNAPKLCTCYPQLPCYIRPGPNHKLECECYEEEPR